MKDPGKMKSAVVIGATGLVGGHLTRLLLQDGRYETVRTFVRRPSGLTAAKLEEHVVDFSRPGQWQEKVTGDELYSAMGTTIKQAGSRQAQYAVDFTCQYEAARAAAKNGISRYLVVSSSGADANSSMFYLRIKGELEEAVRKLPFRNIFLFRPSILMGAREKRRRLEEAGAALTAVACRLVPFAARYRPIEAQTLARAMIFAANMDTDSQVSVYTLAEIFGLAP